ncbi:hypothetical protein V8E36_006799 [Tilletia maclaganii]
MSSSSTFLQTLQENCKTMDSALTSLCSICPLPLQPISTHGSKLVDDVKLNTDIVDFNDIMGDVQEYAIMKFSKMLALQEKVQMQIQLAEAVNAARVSAKAARRAKKNAEHAAGNRTASGKSSSSPPDHADVHYDLTIHRDGKHDSATPIVVLTEPSPPTTPQPISTVSTIEEKGIVDSKPSSEAVPDDDDVGNDSICEPRAEVAAQDNRRVPTSIMVNTTRRSSISSQADSEATAVDSDNEDNVFAKELGSTSAKTVFAVADLPPVSSITPSSSTFKLSESRVAFDFESPPSSPCSFKGKKRADRQRELDLDFEQTPKPLKRSVAMDLRQAYIADGQLSSASKTSPAPPSKDVTISLPNSGSYPPELSKPKKHYFLSEVDPLQDLLNISPLKMPKWASSSSRTKTQSAGLMSTPPRSKTTKATAQPMSRTTRYRHLPSVSSSPSSGRTSRRGHHSRRLALATFDEDEDDEEEELGTIPCMITPSRPRRR